MKVFGGCYFVIYYYGSWCVVWELVGIVCCDDVVWYCGVNFCYVFKCCVGVNFFVGGDGDFVGYELVGFGIGYVYYCCYWDDFVVEFVGSSSGGGVLLVLYVVFVYVFFGDVVVFGDVFGGLEYVLVDFWFVFVELVFGYYVVVYFLLYVWDGFYVVGYEDVVFIGNYVLCGYGDGL